MINALQLWFLTTALAASALAQGQVDSLKMNSPKSDSLKVFQAKETVVSATRSERESASVPIPVTVITKEQIARQGAMRLSEVLEEQTGLAIMHNHGTGVQMQGFDPAYTLILIDGEPVVGRTAGTLELTRFTVANIERVEIIKGPSSALYGSEALGGVVNIITKQAEEPFRAKFNTRFGTFNTLDLNAFAETKQDNLSVSLALNRNSSSGYNLTPNSETLTAPSFQNYTLNPKLAYSFSDQTTLSVAARWLTESQAGVSQSATGQRLIDSRQNLLDWNVSTNLLHKFSATAKSQVRLYGSRYKNDFTNTYRDDGAVFFSGDFDQSMLKAETQTDLVLPAQHLLAFGGGFIREGVAADRIAGGSRSMNTIYVFAQDEWLPFETLNLTASFRFDRNSDFGSQLSPRLAALFKPVVGLAIRASIGSGFKAPTFQQLYLDFTNAAAGYSVFGSTNLRESFSALERSGQIRAVLLNPSDLSQIRAESSIAFNIGAEFAATNALTLKLNVFRNNVRDLIDTQPIAVKSNGGNIFTYFNLNRVFTQGIEAEVALKPLSGLTISAGYQYLEVKDQDVLEQIAAGKIGRSSGDVLNPTFIPITASDYGGLFGRSPHLLNMKLLYENESVGFNGFIRGVWRSRYGFADLNGNLILDNDNEYAPGYAIWDITLTQKLWAGFALQAGIDNVFNQTDIRYTPFLPGRLLFVGLRWESL